MSAPLMASPGGDGGVMDVGCRTHEDPHPSARWPAYRAGGLSVVVGGLVLTVTLVAGGLAITHAFAHSVGRWDEQINALFARHRTPLGNRVTGDFTLIANTFSVIAVGLVVGLIAVVCRRGRLAGLLAIALIVELAVFLATNYAVARPRPGVRHLGSTPSTFSWPSGHVAATFVLYGGMALMLTMVTGRRLPRILAWTVAAVLTTGVGLSRIYRGDHHPTDVMAGLALGIGALCVGVLAVRAWADRAAGPARAGDSVLTDGTDETGPSGTADEIAGVA